jgi:low affinity Fe/Cu permease
MQKRKNSINQKIKLLFFVTPVIMFLTVFLIHLIVHAPLILDGDSTNWITSVIETGIGTSITIAILIYSNNQQRRSEEQQEKIAELVLNIQNIEQRHDERERKRLAVFSHRIISNLETIRQNHHELRQGLTEYLNNNTEENKQSVILPSKKNLDSIVYFIIPNIKSDIGYIGDLFEDPLLSKSIMIQCNEYGTLLKNIEEISNWNKDALMMKISLIDDQVKVLTTTIEKIKNEISKNL